jgi:hypothetical protein
MVRLSGQSSARGIPSGVGSPGVDETAARVQDPVRRPAARLTINTALLTVVWWTSIHRAPTTPFGYPEKGAIQAQQP